MITERFKDLLVAQLGIEPEQVIADAHLEEDLGADSLDLIEIAMAVEEEFKFDISDEEAEKLHRVEDWLTLITLKTSDG
jgi:acyl carrier protein